MNLNLDINQTIFLSSFNNLLIHTLIKNILEKKKYKDIYHNNIKIIENIEICPVCKDLKSNRITDCGHQGCEICLKTWIDNNNDNCYICRKKIYEIFKIINKYEIWYKYFKIGTITIVGTITFFYLNNYNIIF